MKEFLERFPKRMEFLAAVDSIVGRTNRNQEMERLFSSGELDNILLSVVVFIMETTLTEEEDCTINAITAFLAEILPCYGKQLSSAQLDTLSRYLIKDILQNKGETRLAAVMDYEEGLKNIPIRLITDKIGDNNQVLYELTKQGFDFLFRTKEVDDELGFEIEAIRLRMLISKKNYKKATAQSKYIIAMLLEKRNELRQFEQQLNHDIFSVSGDQYDTIVRNLLATLNEEYDIMRDIERLLDLARLRLAEESRLYSNFDEKTLAAQGEVFDITENVQRALGLQRELLIKCEKLRKLYLSLLQDSLLFHQLKRFDLEEQILRPMQQLSFSDIHELKRLNASLLAPLFLPDLRKSLNVSLFYDRQSRLKEMPMESIIEVDDIMDDSGKLQRIQARNEAHVRIISYLLEYAGIHGDFLFSDFWQQLKTVNRLSEIIAERLLFLDMLKLYEIREIDLEKWRGEGIRLMDNLGEFDLDYCLSCYAERDKTFCMIKRISIDKSGNNIVCKTSEQESILIDDLLFEVDKHEGNSGTNS
ncbi:MAG: hypothetical protein FWG43_00270 [Clostridiales bacterium]|nr:hypothetical protein [Clostridiales bacterium]